MNVHLTAQTLSKYICCSLIFCEELKLLSPTKATAEFCEVLNNGLGLTNFPFGKRTLFWSN